MEPEVYCSAKATARKCVCGDSAPAVVLQQVKHLGHLAKDEHLRWAVGADQDRARTALRPAPARIRSAAGEREQSCRRSRLVPSCKEPLKQLVHLLRTGTGETRTRKHTLEETLRDSPPEGRPPETYSRLSACLQFPTVAQRRRQRVLLHSAADAPTGCAAERVG